MQLPKLDTPTYELKIPSTGQMLKYRPFLVKEEKILLVAQESGKTEDIARATIQIINACTFDKIDANKIPMFDAEYILLQLRAKSIGEKTKMKLLCQDDMKTFVETEIDLTEIEVLMEPGHTNKIILDEEKNLGIVFGYPTYELATQGVDMSGTDVDAIFKMLTSCVDHIFEGETIYNSKDMKKEDLIEFIDSMKTSQFEKVQKFFETMPKLAREYTMTNPNTGVKSSVILKGLNDFF